MSCNNVLAALCSQDVASMVMEARTDCPGRFWNSGIMQRASVMDALASGGTWSTDYHFWSFTGNTAENTGYPGTDETCPPCQTVGQKSQIGRKLLRTTCWENAYLNEQCNVTDMTADEVIEEKFGEWGLDVGEADAMAVIRGVFANNTADDGGDLIYDASDAATNPVPNYVSKDAVIEGMRHMGCKRSELQGMIVHEDVMISLEKRDLITMESVDCDDGSCVERSFFMGKQIISVDSDKLTVNGDGTGGYITVLFRPGALAYGVGEPTNGNLQADQDPGADCGAGAVNYYQREQYAIHPVGWSNVFDATAAGHQNMSRADLEAATTWCRAYERRNSGLAFVVSTEAA